MHCRIASEGLVRTVGRVGNEVQVPKPLELQATVAVATVPLLLFGQNPCKLGAEDQTWRTRAKTTGGDWRRFAPATSYLFCCASRPDGSRSIAVAVMIHSRFGYAGTLGRTQCFARGRLRQPSQVRRAKSIPCGDPLGHNASA